MKQVICNFFKGTKYYVVVRKFFGFATPKKKVLGSPSGGARIKLS